MGNQSASLSLGSLFSRLRRWPGVLWRWEAQFKGVEFKGRCDILGRPMISLAKGGRIVVGDNVRIFSSVRGNPLGLAQPCALRAMAPGAQLVLGDGVGLSGTAICAGSSIEIGEQTILGASAMVMDHDFHVPCGEWGWADDCQSNARPIKIGRGVFVGARAIILKGVTIGDRAVIGAGAVLTKDVPPRHIAVGNPARIFEPKS
jgi:acetyltransferase-like isoleucine patch superfamily enzyme